MTFLKKLADWLAPDGKPDRPHRVEQNNSHQLREEDLKDLISQLATLLSQEDKRVMAELPILFDDPQTYLEEAGLEDVEDLAEQLMNGLLIVLEQFDFLLIRDWKDEMVDFQYFYDQLRPVQKAGLTVAQLGVRLDDDDSIPIWAEQLQVALQNRRYGLFAINMDCDSYYLFVCPIAELTRIQALAQQLGYQVVLAESL